MVWRYTLRELAHALGTDAPDADARFTGVSTDTRTIQDGDVFFALKGDRFDGEAFVGDAFRRGARAAVTTVSHAAGPCVVVSDALEALQRFAAYHRSLRTIPVFAVTGSCGKTTAKDLTAAVLETKYRIVKTQGNLNNEIGCPLSLLRIGDETDAAVIEMGANHPGEIARLCSLARPTESAITMVAPAHLEGFGNIENVAAAKAEIVEGLPRDGVFYVNVDDEYCARIGERFVGKKVRFGRSGDVVLSSCVCSGPGEMLLHVDPVGELRLSLACRAHATNVLLAVAVGLRHGVTEFQEPLARACTASSRFKVAQVGPLLVMDDCYNANPASMRASLEALAEWPGDGARLAALGEMLELGEAAPALHRQVGEAAGRAGVAHLFAKGEHARDVLDGARACGVPHAEAFDDDNAVAEAIRSIASVGDKLLVKGSRGMRMERVIQALRGRFPDAK